MRYFVYVKSSEILYESTKAYFSNVHVALVDGYQATISTVSQSFCLLAQTELTTAKTLDERIKFVPLLYAALEKEPYLSGLQIGYENGDCFLVRVIGSEDMRVQFLAPKDTVAIVDHIALGADGKRYIHRFYYSRAGMLTDSLVKEITDFDPRTRPWFKYALESSGEVVTKPYYFYFMKKMGITMSHQVPGTGAVLGCDITLEHLSIILDKYRPSPHVEMVLLEQQDKKFMVAAYHDIEKLVSLKKDKSSRIYLSDLKNDVLNYLVANEHSLDAVFRIKYKGEYWFGSHIVMDKILGKNIFLLLVAPEKELLSEARQQQEDITKYTFLILLLSVPIVWFLAKRISDPLQNAVVKTRQIASFDFSNKADLPRSMIKEIDDLNRSVNIMENTIADFMSLITVLANEENFDKLLKKIVKESKAVAQADMAFSYLIDNEENVLKMALALVGPENSLYRGAMPICDLSMESCVMGRVWREHVVIMPWSKLMIGEKSPLENEKDPYVVVFPLWTRKREKIGVLGLLYRSDEQLQHVEDQGLLVLLESFSRLAAITLETRKMFSEQKRLLESFIELIAKAIDSKSRHTGGHCARVPVLAKLLAQEACRANYGIFADYNLNDEQWEALHIASWLHDCGKVTTPEYIVDKATKLETIYDRIHEIRMRFEVLKRDVHIEYYKHLLAGENEAEQRQKRDQLLEELDADFAFIAHCNMGREFMGEGDRARLHKISTRTWQRTISDRLGISYNEEERKSYEPDLELPVIEQVLSDKQHHLHKREFDQSEELAEKYGFVRDTPEYLYNRGELYNLSISRGTLTEEERYKINDHIVQTIVMLNQLSFPGHLKDVPEIAGGHHERIDGQGYPKRLTGDKMSITAKIMAIADIFEALTASDRPYKKAFKLSQALTIMTSMRDNGHIDKDLFELFLRTGAYLEYAKGYLHPDQIDEFDIEACFKKKD